MLESIPILNSNVEEERIWPEKKKKRNKSQEKRVSIEHGNMKTVQKHFTGNKKKSVLHQWDNTEKSLVYIKVK